MLCDGTADCEATRKQYVRDLAGGLIEAVVKDELITQAILDGDDRMQVGTSNRNWQSTDADWKTALNASSHYAAAIILSRLPGADPIKQKEILLNEAPTHGQSINRDQ